MIVEVRFGGHHVVFLRQHGRDKFLGRGLAVGAGDAQDRDVELTPVEGGQFLEHLQRVFHHDAFAAPPGSPFQQEPVHDGIFGSGLEGVDGKIIAVERFALQGIGFSGWNC